MKWACLFLVFLYLLTLNGYMMPQGHDDVIYYQAAKYMAKENAYPIGGIPEWGIYEVGFPPGFPFLMALLMKMGITSVFAMKGVVLAMAFGAALFLYQIHPMAALFFLVNPHTLIYSTRLFAEIPFAFWSIACLYLLEYRPKQKALQLLTLVAAILTRFIGLALLFPFVLKRQWDAVVVGAATFLLWKLYITVNAPTDLGFNFVPTIGTFFHFDLWSFFPIFGDLFTFSHRLPLTIQEIIGLTLFSFYCWRLYQQRRTLNSWDLYTGVTLSLLMLFKWKYTRYLIPVAPFLFLRMLPKRTVILFPLFVLDCLFIFYGNGHSHGALTPLVSQPFYRGSWNDLYQTSQFLKQHCQEVSVINPQEPRLLDRYISYYADCTIKSDASYMVTYQFQGEGEKIFQAGDYAIYRREG